MAGGCSNGPVGRFAQGGRASPAWQRSVHLASLSYAPLSSSIHPATAPPHTPFRPCASLLFHHLQHPRPQALAEPEGTSSRLRRVLPHGWRTRYRCRTLCTQPDHIHLFVAFPEAEMTLTRWISLLKLMLGKELRASAIMGLIGRKDFSITCFAIPKAMERNGSTCE